MGGGFRHGSGAAGAGFWRPAPRIQRYKYGNEPAAPSVPAVSSFRSMISSLLLSLFAFLQTGQQPADLHWADLGFDRGLFQITDPEASQSPALRINEDLVSKSGRVPLPTSGYTLASRLIVQTEDGAALAALTDALGAFACDRLADLPDFWLVEAGSVRAALQLREALAQVYGQAAVYLDARRPWSERLPNDPGFVNQWHLYNTVNPLFDANVEGAWNAGHTGQGVVIGVIDGGVYVGHPDLDGNYNSAASQNGSGSSHGTSCAGVAAAEEGNGIGGVGAAYDAQWSNMYYGFSSTNAAAFAHRNDLNDIKTNSWGPADNGTLAYWTSAESSALQTAATSGRGGLGVIFTWAAGNGGNPDRVEYDPYASSRHTIAVGAITNGDVRSGYNETGSSMFCVAQSDGGSQGIYTTSGSSGYTFNFGGTSSASPLGAGVVALVLGANPALSWRDVQHVLVESARINDAGNSLWTTNGDGRMINYNYGFGAVDATAAVQMALNWTLVGAEQSSDSGVQAVNAAIPDNNAGGIVRTFMVNDSFVLESVEVIMNVDHNYIGDLEVTLTSPDGTASLLTKKRNDTQDDFVNYVLTSHRCWGEDSAGLWTIKVADLAVNASGTWQNYRLKVYGYDGSGGPGGNSALSSGTVTAGANASFQLAQGVPNANAWLAASKTGPGSTVINALGVTLGLASPFPLAGPTATDGAGALNWNVFVPPGAQGASFWMQAAQQGRISNVLSGVVQ